MFLNIFLIFLIIITLGIIFLIIIKKIPQLRRVDPQQNQLFTEDQIKNKMIEKKFQNDFDFYRKKIIIFIKPVLNFIYQKLKKVYLQIYKLERKYRKKLIQTHFENKVSQENSLAKSLEKAKKYIKEKKWDAAENEYIEALKTDLQNIEIYKNLADLYFQKKDYLKAKETYEYILNLQKDAFCYNELGKINQKIGDLKQSLINHQKSVELENNNPLYYYNLAKINLKLEEFETSLKNIKKGLNLDPSNPQLLDFIINLSIIMGDKDLGKNKLQKLIEIEPENKKISELREKINKL